MSDIFTNITYLRWRSLKLDLTVTFRHSRTDSFFFLSFLLWINCDVTGYVTGTQPSLVQVLVCFVIIFDSDISVFSNHFVKRKDNIFELTFQAWVSGLCSAVPFVSEMALHQATALQQKHWWISGNRQIKMKCEHCADFIKRTDNKLMFQAGDSGLSSVVLSVPEFRYSTCINLPVSNRDIVDYVRLALLESPEEDLSFYLENSWKPAALYSRNQIYYPCWSMTELILNVAAYCRHMTGWTAGMRGRGVLWIVESRENILCKYSRNWPYLCCPISYI